MSADIEHARDLLARADAVVVLTGAGVSAESGVPTFRGAKGLWKSYRPEELATPEAFRRDPLLVWEWYTWRRELIGRCRPNDAHRALAALALAHDSFTIVTQNVDGLHHRAADDVAGGEDRGARAYPLEVHGAIHRDRCWGCGARTRGLTSAEVSGLEAPPTCEACGGMLRPDVIWFGEALGEEVIGASFDAARAADVCLVVGTSAVVYPAASVPEVTLQAGGSVVEINPEATPLTARSTVSLRGLAGELVPAVLSQTI